MYAKLEQIEKGDGGESQCEDVVTNRGA